MIKNIVSNILGKNKSKFETFQKVLIVFILIYLFLIAIGLMGSGLKLLGTGFSTQLLEKTTNPIVALFIGVLATSIIQSSSSTTSIIISLLAVGSLNLTSAIALIMGANIGTSITNLIVSLTYYNNREEFYLSFKAALLHVTHNIMSVAILFPLELKFHFLEKMATKISSLIYISSGFSAPQLLTNLTKPTVKAIISLIDSPLIILIISLFLLYYSLKTITKVAKKYLNLNDNSRQPKTELVTTKLFSNPIKSFSTGLGLTFLLQSSSVTTSLIIPFSALRILSLKEIFPFSLGANIGTTITPFMAALATGNITALSLSFVHIGFNILGALIAIPLFKIPLKTAKIIARTMYFHKENAIFYIIAIFFIIPSTIIFILI